MPALGFLGRVSPAQPKALHGLGIAVLSPDQLRLGCDFLGAQPPVLGQRHGQDVHVRAAFVHVQ
ncbi:hypothetical protein D3C80_2122670 [compost metagenome]